MPDQSTARFWDTYIEKARLYGVKPGVARWYVRRVEAYIKAHRNLRLSQHSSRQIEKYLRSGGVKSCQGGLALAARTKKTGALAEGGVHYGLATTEAGLALTAIDLQLLGEVIGLASALVIHHKSHY